MEMLAFYFLRKDTAIMNNIEMIMASFQRHQGFLTFQQVLEEQTTLQNVAEND